MADLATGGPSGKAQSGTGGESEAALEPDATLALLTAVYGIDPQRLLEMPQYLLKVLADHVNAVEAHRTQNFATAATIPHLDKNGMRSATRDLERATRPFRAKPVPKRMEHIEHDPEKAKEWFAAQGLMVDSA